MRKLPGCFLPCVDDKAVDSVALGVSQHFGRKAVRLGYEPDRPGMAVFDEVQYTGKLLATGGTGQPQHHQYVFRPFFRNHDSPKYSKYCGKRNNALWPLWSLMSLCALRLLAIVTMG